MSDAPQDGSRKLSFREKVGWLCAGLLLGFGITFVVVRAAARNPDGFLHNLVRFVMRPMTNGPRDTPIVMEGGSIRAHSDLSWTVDPEKSYRYTTDLPDTVKAITVRDSYDETKEVDHINLKTDDWSITLQEQTPDQATVTTRNAFTIKPAHMSDRTIVLETDGRAADGVLTLNSGDLRFHYRPNSCDQTDAQQRKCDLLYQIVITSHGQPDKTILCKSGGQAGDEAGKCRIRFVLKKCPDSSNCFDPNQ